MLVGIQLLMSLVVGLSVLALAVGVRSLVAPGESADRVQQLLGTGAPGATVTLRDLEMRASFYQRAIKPIIFTLLQKLGRLAPQRNIEQLQQKLETGGLLARLSVVDFLGLKILCGIFFGVIPAAAFILLKPDSMLIFGGLTLLLAGLGFTAPNIWLSTRINKRQGAVLRALPDALDMMAICVDAGLGLQGAMQTVCENWENALVEEFTRVLAEVRLGRSALDALESMGKRTGVNEVISFVMALTLAHRLGISIAKVLPIQAEQMRIARRQKAEETARQAAIKMLFPLVFLIFPAMFAVILGPAVPQLVETLGGL
jgi:tight adherence protein C